MSYNLSLKLYEMGEYKIQRFIKERLANAGVLGDSLEDDCAFINGWDGNTGIAVSSDFVPTGISGPDFGKFLVIQNVSDVLCSGATPKKLLIGLGLSREMRLSELCEILDGIIEEAQKYCIKIIGGDTKEANVLGGYAVCFGRHENNVRWQRNGSQTKDRIAVTLSSGRLWGWRWAHVLVNSLALEIDPALKKQLEKQYHNIALPINILSLLRKQNIVQAAMDMSDGLGSSLKTMIAVGNAEGAVLEKNRLQWLVAPELAPVANAAGIPMWSLALSPGYHWQTVLALRTEKDIGTPKLPLASSDTILEIGTFSDKHGIYVSDKESSTTQITFVDDEKFLNYPWEEKSRAWITWAKTLLN